MSGIVVTRNPLFASFDSKLRARLSKGASALIPETWTHILRIADPTNKTLVFTKNGDSTIPVYRWKHDHGVRIPIGRFAFDVLCVDPEDVVAHRFVVAKGTPEDPEAPAITIYLDQKIR